MRWVGLLARRPGAAAMVVAVIALAVALGGVGYAAFKVPRGSVGHAQLRPGAVQSDNVKDGSLLTRDFNPHDLPKGPKGDPGATIVVIRASTGLATPPGQIGSAIATCQGDERATGGGGSFAGDPDPNDRIVISRPSSGQDAGGGTPIRWEVAIVNGNPAGPRTPTAYVVCASP
jgi:hypothetical protein